jgi:hypothetical protein
MTSINSPQKLHRLFLLITAIGAVHMGEQLVFGIEEFHMLRALVGRWHALFPASMEGHASVILITIVFCAVSLMIYAALRGGAAAIGVVLVFGLLGVGEAHHWIESIAKRAYDPGLATSFPFVLVGVLIVRQAWSLLTERAHGGPSRGAA